MTCHLREALSDPHTARHLAGPVGRCPVCRQPSRASTAVVSVSLFGAWQSAWALFKQNVMCVAPSSTLSSQVYIQMALAEHLVRIIVS